MGDSVAAVMEACMAPERTAASNRALAIASYSGVITNGWFSGSSGFSDGDDGDAKGVRTLSSRGWSYETVARECDCCSWYCDGNVGDFQNPRVRGDVMIVGLGVEDKPTPTI